MLLQATLPGLGSAQIVRDGTVGPAIGTPGVIEPTGLNFRIDSTLGAIKSSNGTTNLFHSFSEFNVNLGESATFTNSFGGTINNILSRVTGNNPSTINGLLASEIPGANLYLLNPRGVVFGLNASLDIGASIGQPGSLFVSTADYVKLSDGALFHTVPDIARDALLSSAPVAAFGFLGPTFEEIRVAGSTLTLATGTDLSLIGGNISIGADAGSGTPAFISAPSGEINLVSVASPGEILYPSLQTGPNINGQTFTAKGTMSLSDFSSLDVSGITGQGNGAGGAVRIRGGQFEMDNISVINNLTIGDTAGKNLGISIVVDHDVRLSNLSILAVGTDTGLGRSGNLEVNAENVEVLSGSILTSTSSGPAAPGDIIITASKSLTVSGLDPFSGTEPSRISTSVQSSVEGGNIAIDFAGSTLSVQDDAIINTSSGTGNAGNITLNSGVLTLTNGGRVSSDSGNGSSGTIMITASDSAVITGKSALANPSSITNSSTTSPANISITAGEFVLADQATIDGDTAGQQGGTVNITATQSINISGNSTIRSSTAGGTGTSLELSAPSIAINQSTLSTRISGSNPNNVGGTIAARATNGNLTVSNNSLIAASTAGAADGGSIELHASDSIIVTANSHIESTSTGAGNAGNIAVNAGQSLDLRDSSIKAEASQASGGNIDIRAVDRVRLVNSTISTSVLGGAGSGGNITIDPNVVVLQNSQILAQAIQGNGGNITIFTPLFLADQSSLVSASSQFGLYGTVTIQSPTSNLSGSLGPLASKPSQAQSLLTQRCAALANGQASSFVVAGREQLPADPGGWLSGPIALAALSEGPPDASDAVASAPAVMAMADQDSGRVLLRRLTPSGFLIANFADSKATGCHS